MASRGRATGQGSKPPEAESFSVVGCPNEMENVLQNYFTTYLLFSKNVLSCIHKLQQCCGEVSLGDRLQNGSSYAIEPFSVISVGL